MILFRTLLLLCLVAAAAFAGEPPTLDPPDGMVLVPAGEFMMGRSFETEDDKRGMRPLVLRDDLPAHAVRLDAFYMGSREVTEAEYKRFVKAAAHRAPYHWLGGTVPEGTEDFPVHNVDWFDAKAYCEWQGKRLPTEAEWERAARGDLEGKHYPWGDDQPDRTRAHFNTPLGPKPVGSHAPNEFGLHDMASGVAEWCSDWFERTYYEHSPAGNPRGPEQGMYRIIRGGSWSSGPRRITVFFRNWVRPNQRTPNLGFRCVKNAPAQAATQE